METAGIKGQILFSGKKKRNITNLSSAELAQRKVKQINTHPFSIPSIQAIHENKKKKYDTTTTNKTVSTHTCTMYICLDELEI